MSRTEMSGIPQQKKSFVAGYMFSIALATTTTSDSTFPCTVKMLSVYAPISYIQAYGSTLISRKKKTPNFVGVVEIRPC